MAYIGQAIFFGLLAQSTLFLVGALLVLCMRISSGVIIPLDTSLLQTSTEPDMRGRVFALHEATYSGVMQVSYILAGLAYTHIGIPHTGIIVGAMSLLCGISWLWQFGAGAVAALHRRATG